MAAAVVFVVAATGSAIRETPTIDEYAHVPAGLLHWRQGRFDMYRNNPPPGKMWVALPLAIDSSVVSPEIQGSTVSWGPWFYAMQFERENAPRYLSLMTRARLMNIPLVLAMAALVFLWCRQLYGPLAAGISTSLLLLSPTILAHGHVATLDVATALTMLVAVLAARWASQRPSWRRAALAGIALGVAMLIKFSSLYLVLLLPAIFIAVAWHTSPPAADKGRTLFGHVATYLAAVWLTVNLGMGFSGTFDTVSSLDLGSRSVRGLMASLPGWLPLGLPRAYIEGIDALKFDIEQGGMSGYLLGRWSELGWASYYPIAFAIKETEPVVILTMLSLVALPLVIRDWRELAYLVAPPVMLLVIAAFFNTLCLGIRYILPMYPFLFVMQGACFAWIERRVQTRQAAAKQKVSKQRINWRWLIVAPLIVYSVAVTVYTYPAYLAYFNRFIGGPGQGAKWLADSNLDWGQDLHRVSQLAQQYGVDRWQLLYFGHVDPARYEIDFDLPGELPEFKPYLVSVNYALGISYAVLHSNGQAEFMNRRVQWLQALLPTAQHGAWMVFDLRPESLNASDAPHEHYNAGVVHSVRGEHAQALKRLRRALELDPQLTKAYLPLANVYFALEQPAEAMRLLQTAVQQDPNWEEALNNLAWHLATAADPAQRDAERAIELAERACRLTRRENLSFLDTLMTAYASAGRRDAALRVCREAIEKADAANQPIRANEFRHAEQQLLNLKVTGPVPN